jgi:hypothetical protein
VLSVSEKILAMRRLKRLLEEFPRMQAAGDRTGYLEQKIASLYVETGELGLAGEWFVRAALQAEGCERPLRAIAILRGARRVVPDHLGVARELRRLESLWPKE